jgi:hypothetical protein
MSHSRMRSLGRRLVIATASIALAMGFIAPGAAQAETDLTGRWVSDSLRDNRIGYYLVLRPGRTAVMKYVGHLRFEFRDGRRNARIPVRAQVIGDDVFIIARKGTFDRAGRVLRAEIDPRSGALRLTNCLQRLRLVMANGLESDCVFRLSR